MTEETFHLTQLTDTSRRLVLPALVSPRHFRKRSISELRPGYESERKLRKSTSVRLKVQEKLTKVREDVKSSFELLYTSHRSSLLSKAMKLEHCESVRDQLHSLESHVVAQVKHFNCLQNKRRAKDELLESLLKELESLQEADMRPVLTCSNDVERKLEQTTRRIERENDYTGVLEHMISEHTKAIGRKVQPIYHLRKELQQIKIRYHENEVDTLRVSLEHKSLRTSLRRSEEKFDQQRAHHSHRVQDKVSEYRRRAEFTEFIHRQEVQKDIQTRIRLNELEVRGILKMERDTQSAEEFVEASKAQTESLGDYEKLGEKLVRAAHTGSIQEVLEYWTYLQEFGESLKGKVDSGTKRVGMLRDELEDLRRERSNMRLNLTLPDAPSDSQLSHLQSYLDSKESQVCEATAKLDLWQQEIASLRGRLEGLLVSAGGQIGEYTLEELLERTGIVIGKWVDQANI